MSGINLQGGADGITCFPVGRGHEDQRSSIETRQLPEMRDPLNSTFMSEAAAEATSPTLKENESEREIITTIEASDFTLEYGENNNSYLVSLPQFGSGVHGGSADVEDIKMNNEDNDVEFLSSSQSKRS